MALGLNLKDPLRPRGGAGATAGGSYAGDLPTGSGGTTGSGYVPVPGGGAISSSTPSDGRGAQPTPTGPATVAPSNAPTPPPVNISAQLDPTLTRLSGKGEQYLKDIEEGTGHAMDIAGQKFRDAREGGRTALMQANALAGRPDTAGLGDYESTTQRGVQGALADVALGREAMRGNALGMAIQAARTPIDVSQAEKGIGLGAYNAQVGATQAANAANQANYQSAFNQMMALLQAQRSSPLYYGAA